MTKYYLPLTEQETLSLRQLANQPGYDVIFKLLQMESLDAQSAAMESTDKDAKQRLLILSDAQATVRIVSNLIKKLASYQSVIQADVAHGDLEIIENLWDSPTDRSN